VTASDLELGLLLGGAALLAAGEIGKHRQVRTIGLATLFAGWVMTVIGLLAGSIPMGA
jgi:uncharacterized membrane protein (DUF4010 family)